MYLGKGRSAVLFMLTFTKRIATIFIRAVGHILAYYHTARVS